MSAIIMPANVHKALSKLVRDGAGYERFARLSQRRDLCRALWTDHFRIVAFEWQAPERVEDELHMYVNRDDLRSHPAKAKEPATFARDGLLCPEPGDDLLGKDGFKRCLDEPFTRRYDSTRYKGVRRVTYDIKLLSGLLDAFALACPYARVHVILPPDDVSSVGFESHDLTLDIPTSAFAALMPVREG